jgi:hypothetical protein
VFRRVFQLIDEAIAVARHFVKHMDGVQLSQLCNILWALSSAGIQFDPLLEHLNQLPPADWASVTYTDIATVLWSLANISACTNGRSLKYALSLEGPCVWSADLEHSPVRQLLFNTLRVREFYKDALPTPTVMMMLSSLFTMKVRQPIVVSGWVVVVSYSCFHPV